MGAQSSAAPVIIKRKKVVASDGHHGGAWKVAYADFVTAMMAFFLLMWLLNATTEKQRKGLADYFSPTIPINRISGGGDGDFGGESVFSEDTLPKNGTGATQHHATESLRARGETGVAQDDGADSSKSEIAEMKMAFDEALRGLSGESMVADELQRHVITRVTDEGLVVEIFETQHARLFETGKNEPTKLLMALSELVVELAALVTNPVAVEAHVKAVPIVLKENPVWSLSAARSDTLRLLMLKAGLDGARVQRITGHADREPAVSNLMAVRNNRVEVIFLREDSLRE